MLLGSLVYYALFGVNDNVKGNSDYGWDNTTKGIDWWRHVWQIAVARRILGQCVASRTSTGPDARATRSDHLSASLSAELGSSARRAARSAG